MNPIVMDGVGTIWFRDEEGNLKYVDEKINSVIFAPQFQWTKVFGGQSGYPFHLTAQDLQDIVTIEVPRYSPALAEITQGSKTKVGPKKMDEMEEGILSNDGYQIKGLEKYNITGIVAESDEVNVKDANGNLKKLERVAATPTVEQYTITSTGLIKSADENKDKVILVTYKWSAESSEATAFDGLRKPKPFKFVHRFELLDDKTRQTVQCQLTIYNAIGGGTTNIGAQRKTPSVNQLQLEVLEGYVSPDNPDGIAAEIVFAYVS
ncbi:hypothetical protein [Paenibacillus endoradicis]|uniref:hypothetical protein n=1 Tax=Paenibacillus endoradicis TaxID=2972487 RepID=UPI002159A5AB|nr:hypothetical protein [Paenibacillus endoradicis]MCR8656931.1 hypothetical protein [Paenibacillus endoradicis]